MASPEFLRRTVLGLLGTAFGVLLLATISRADELGGSGSSSGFVIHDPTQVLHDYCRTDADGVLWLELPDGARFELVTSTADPAIRNPGDGAFHPFDPIEVRAALDGVAFPLGRVGADVFLLPYPRRAGLESAAGPGLVLLAPGVMPLTHEHQHAEFVHELGHVVQYARMPDTDAQDWEAYRALRGIADLSRFSAGAPHADRPHEIFAEDFRALFGDPLATYSGTIENAWLTPPAQVPGLREFILGLEGDRARASLTAFPNPTRGTVSFSRAGGTARPMELFDLGGRRIVSLAPTVGPAGTTWSWDRRDAEGRRVPRGVLFARVRGERETLRVTMTR